MKKLRIAIVGCNNMGTKHLFALREHFAKEVSIAGILNSCVENSRCKALLLDVPFFQSLDEINKRKVDAIILATPAETHFELAQQIIAKNIPLLVEKPFASTDEECQALVKQALKNNAKVMVGHTENYNPAVIKLKELLGDTKILSIAGVRASNNPGFKKTHVISELMIHDLAIVNALIGSDFETAIVTKKEEYRWDEHAIVEMKYFSGQIVRLEAKRFATEPERHMRIIDEHQNVYKIEFLSRKLYKNNELICEGGNSLQAELTDFISMLSKNTAPLTGVEEAADIVHLCQELESASKQ